MWNPMSQVGSAPDRDRAAQEYGPAAEHAHQVMGRGRAEKSVCPFDR